MSNYLLEIGVEEIPSDYIKASKRQLKEKFEKLLEENKFSVEEIRIESTPRRFAVFLNDMRSLISEELISVRGPNTKIAYDEDGNPNKPLLGFLKGQGADISDIIIKEQKGENYIFIEKKEESKSIADVLKDNVYDIVKSISFPRSMRRGGKSIRWARPIRRFVSLLDDEILKFDAEGILVSNITKGHRVLGSDHIVIEKIEDYENLLKENYVILKASERRDIILRGLNRLATQNGGEYMKDEALLEEIINIVEYPTVLIGDIDPVYLNLPKEVIITPMKDHQRYFPVQDENKNLLPFFLVVRNGDQTDSENVIEGNKKVLVARLEDAKFFYELDSKKPLEFYVDELKDLTFFEGLGTMYQKTERLIELTDKYIKELSLGEDIRESLKRAALLSKADLVTKMVVEFTELQGIMGKIYANNAGEECRVASAIEEQYMPTSSKGALPKSIIGIVLSIADKMDTIVGLYAIERYVTGSQDPFGLRRQALGIINIFLKNNIDVDLRDLINDALLVYTEENELPFDYDTTMDKILEFFKDRLKNKLMEDGYRYDIVNSVLETKELNILKIYLRCHAISEFIEDNEDTLTYFTRINNLSKDMDFVDVDESLFENEYERDFYNKISGLPESSFQNSDDYKNELMILETTKESGNDYLDNTMINVEDEKIKHNRLAMLNIISNRLKKVFDIEKIVR